MKNPPVRRSTTRRRKRRRRQRRLRAQPRSKTPPVGFRFEDGSDRVVLLLDEEFTTSAPVRTTSRQPILLRLGPGLRVTLQSRRINKRRYPQLVIKNSP